MREVRKMKLDHLIADSRGKKIYRDGDKCIKVFNGRFSKADVLTEALNQARIEETGLNIPKVLEIETFDGNWAIVSEFIEGETLASLMEKNPERRDEYLEQFVDIQLEIQSKMCPSLRIIKDKMNAKINAADIDATTRYELHTRLEAMPNHIKVCHGDFNPTNVIITKNGEHFVIDWAHATQGNASADAARTYLLFCLDGDEDTAKKYLKLFCKKSDTAMQYVQKWMPIVAASQSVKGNAKEREFLLGWVDVVEYE